MKIRLISLFIATAAIVSACCGVFYAQNPEKQTVIADNAEPVPFAFSLSTAASSLWLCEIAGFDASISAELEKTGFEDIELFQYEQGLKSDNKAGLVIAHKDNTLIMVIRGTKDEEWYSNFNIGDSVEHAGFSKAADLVMKNSQEYISRHGLNKADTEVFLTGHSRGAAVANITAARLIDSKAYENISAYTFACPNTTRSGSAADAAYSSIVNIINPQDFICYIPLPKWGYTRYGRTVELPKSDTAANFDQLYSEMEKEYMSLTETQLKDFPHKSKDVENIISYLGYLAPTPNDYYEKEIAVGGFRLTMYDYMMKLAAVMNNENPLLHGLFMLSCKAVPEVCPITDFVFSTMSKEELKNTTGLTDTAVVVNHLPNAYFAWLKTLDEEYFTERLA